MRKYIPFILSVLTLIVLWEVLAFIISYPAIFPDLKTLLQNIIQLFSRFEFYFSVVYTVLRGIIGFFIAFTCALLLATLSGYTISVRNYLHPIVVVLRTIPVISLVLIALLWFSPDGLPVFIAFFTMFPILYQNILNGFDGTDIRLVEMSEVFRKSKFQIWKYVYLPSAKQLIFSGVKTAFGFGWRAVIIGEALSQPLHGIGSGMKHAQSFINVSELIAWTVVAILVSAAFEWLISVFENKIKIRYDFVLKKKEEALKHENIDKIHSLGVAGLSRKYNDVHVEYVDCTFQNNSIYCLKSSSGSGKTTFLRLLAGLEQADCGVINRSNIQRIAYSFQDNRLVPWLTVRENILYGCSSAGWQGVTDFTEHYLALVRTLDIEGILNKYPSELSGGQQQRVGLARALVFPVDLLLLDEPLNGLDVKLKKTVISLIEDYVFTYQPLVIWATHENIVMQSVNVLEVNVLKHADK